MPLWKKSLFLFILTVLFPTAFIVLLETGLRLGGYGYSTRLFLEEPDAPGVLRHNRDFTSPWFGRRAARELFPLQVNKEPPEGTVRILILGASAALGDPAPSFSPARMLEAALEESFPGSRFECINLAITAINSTVVSEIAWEARCLQADLAIIYLGNNEVIGPSGSRLLTALKRTRLAQLAEALASRENPDEQWGGMAQFLEHRYPPDAPRLGRVYRDFERNLVTIIGTLRDSGVEPVISTVAVNLLEQPPFWGKEALDTYLAGSGTAARGDTAGAFPVLDAAKELDQLRFRADNTINEIIRRIARSMEIPLIEAAGTFNNPTRLAGSDEFLEHVHFTFEGNHKLVGLFHEAVAHHLVETRGIAPDRAYPEVKWLKDRLSHTLYDRYLTVEEMIERLERAPFTEVHGNTGRLEAFVREKEQIISLFGRRATRERILESYEKARSRDPDDWVLQRNQADALRLYGRFAEAAILYKNVLRRFPDSEDARAGLEKCRNHLQAE
ncbi:MAG: hypothetical protein ACP5I4_16610 [Oceanipulchritudo sp.]